MKLSYPVTTPSLKTSVATLWNTFYYSFLLKSFKKSLTRPYLPPLYTWSGSAIFSQYCFGVICRHTSIDWKGRGKLLQKQLSQYILWLTVCFLKKPIQHAKQMKKQNLGEQFLLRTSLPVSVDTNKNALCSWYCTYQVIW